MRTSIQARHRAVRAAGIALSLHGVICMAGGNGAAAGTGLGRLTQIPGGQAGGSMPAADRTVYLFGKVLLDDGTPPPDPVVIESVCGGSVRAQAYTDLKGRFSFQIGQTAGVLQDASEAGTGLRDPGRPMNAIGMEAPYADQQSTNCELRAVLSGFRSDMISLVGRHFVDDGNVGTIVLHRLSDVEGSAISLNSLQAPAKARHAYEKALLDMQRDKLPAAAKELRKAVDIYPNYAAAWFELGRIQQHDGDMAQARVSFKTAIATDPKYISPYLYLIELEATAEEWTELASTTDLLLKLDATDYPAAYFCSAIANLRLGQLDAAEKSARAGEKLDTAHRYPQLEEVLATVLAMKKDYAGAAGHMRSYLALAPDAKDAPQMKEELAELETYKPVKAGPAHE
ncbi:MAG: tetratricopeptide repeat protein [Bryobacteraceae bacterium]|jgi:hypothetical protein